MKDNFEQLAWEAFQEAAAEKYDFTTCQRSDGSYYGTGGTCRKGTETTKSSSDDKKKSSGGGGTQLDKASRNEYAKQAKREQQSVKDIKADMKRNGKTPELEKKLKQTEARAEKFDRFAKTGIFTK